MRLKRAELSNPSFVQQSVRILLDDHLQSYSVWVASNEQAQRAMGSSENALLNRLAYTASQSEE